MAKSIINFPIYFRFPTKKYPRETNILSKGFNLLPNEVKKYLRENPIMLGSEIEGYRANAMVISHETFKNHKYLVHIHHHVWKYSEKEIIHVLFHEIAHIYLGHNLEGNISTQSLDKMEREAEKLIHKWLENYEEIK